MITYTNDAKNCAHAVWMSNADWEIALKHDVKTTSTGNYLGHKPL